MLLDPDYMGLTSRTTQKAGELTVKVQANSILAYKTELC